jgi:hypothetical protein
MAGVTPRYVFIGGLHRSGTSILHRCIAADPRVTGFAGTGVPEDEGQFLQSVYPPALLYGGAGRFGFDPRSHVTELSPLATAEKRDRLVWEWGYHWDTDRPVRVEKSPPNMLKLRFLQALFPDAHFIIMVRDPVAVTMSTSRWVRESSLTSLVHHWVHCHELMWADATHIRRLKVVHYEDFVRDPGAVLADVGRFLELGRLEGWSDVRPGLNAAYHRRWSGSGPLRRIDAAVAVRRYQREVRRLGYSLQ